MLDKKTLEVIIDCAVQIKTHTRKLKSGKTITIGAHSRAGDPAKQRQVVGRVKKPADKPSVKKRKQQDPDYVKRAKKLYSAGQQTQKEIAKVGNLGSIGLKKYTIKGIIEHFGGKGNINLPENNEEIRKLFKEAMKTIKDFVVDNGGITKVRGTEQYDKFVKGMADLLEGYFNELKQLNQPEK
jgi:hypothetical protein